ncbi:MAG: putative Protein methyltransferase frzF [Firmicutes bacterium]|nr:putative Protein methyltransferase frzF [Bacillota bacterium]
MSVTANSLTACALEKISLFITKRYGLEFRQHRQELLWQAVQERMQACTVSSTEQYLRLLQQGKEEVLLLINLLTIHETYFFREPAHFAIIRKQIIPRLAKSSGPKPFFRLLSAGCSTGEEAYSLAMTLLTIPGTGIDWDFEIIGVDVDTKAIHKAQAGLYGSYSFRSCSREIQNNCFERLSKDCFLIKRQVKEKVRFEALNLFEQVYPDWLQNLDIVFYRNVSIYFSREQQQDIFHRLTGLLKPEGCLFLSCTETLYHHNKHMILVNSGDAFYYQKTAATLPSVAIAKSSQYSVCTQPPPAYVPPQKKRPLTRIPRKLLSPLITTTNPKPCLNTDDCCQLFNTALILIKSKKRTEALQCVDQLLSADSQFIQAYTLKANILLGQQQLTAAIKLCKTALVLEPFCLEAYLLLGMAAKLDNRFDDALQHFKEAVYVTPECWLAHFYLAEIYQFCSEIAYAKREYEVTSKLLKQGNFDNHGLSFFDMPFQLNDFLQLCQYNLEKLQN